MTLSILFASLLLTSLINHGSSSSSSDPNKIISSSCATTLYPDICHSTIFSDINMQTNYKHLPITKKHHVIQLTLYKTKDHVQSNLQTITSLITTTANLNLTKRTTAALHDCLEMEAATLQQLDTVIRYLKNYPTHKNIISLRRYADDLKTLMSTAITNKETCIEELSFDDADSTKHIRKSVIEGQEHGGKMCSNVLAMIKNMTTTDTDHKNNNNNNNRRKLKEINYKGGIMWPEWLPAGDRKLLGLFGVTPNVTVAKNGKGNYTTVAAAVDGAPSRSNRRYVIKIMAGTYKEYIHIPNGKTNIMFVGEGRGSTIITGNKNVKAGDGTTTTKSATVAVMGDKFLARDITFQNTAGPSGEQAVALRVASDLSAFYKCGMEGYQDTLYVHSKRQFFVKCFITGTVDFIFGNAAVVFQFCDIMARKPGPGQNNMITAQGRTDVNQDTGIVIQKCNIGATQDLKPVQANFSTYLGRPWKKFSRTVVMRSMIGDVIKKEGWCPWDGDFALDTLYYREYRNWGAGSDTSHRVKWKGLGVMKDDNEARPFTVAKFINGWSWLLSTGFPFWPGL